MPETCIVNMTSAGPVAEIPDNGGELHEYAIRKPEGFAPSVLFVRELVKMHEPREGETYRVELRHDGWRCSCADWRYRFRRNRGTRLAGQDCKHIEAAKSLRKLLESA